MRLLTCARSVFGIPLRSVETAVALTFPHSAFGRVRVRRTLLAVLFARTELELTNTTGCGQRNVRKIFLVTHDGILFKTEVELNRIGCEDEREKEKLFLMHHGSGILRSVTKN